MSVRSRVYRERRLPAERPLAAIIAGLWRNGEQGVWYDTSDLSTMFQDAAGVLPVYMPGQGQVDPPVGLLLDKRLGLALGPELVSNGGFATDTWWSKDTGVAITGGACVFSATTSRGVYRSSLTQIGKCYVVTYTVVVNSGAIRPLIAGSFGVSRTTSGTYTEVLSGTSGALFGLFANPSFDGAVDNVSLREVLGNHAYQTTTTSRPTLSARYNLLTATDTLTTQSVTTVATSYTLKLTGAGSVTLSGTAAGSYSAGTYTITCTAGSLTLTVSGSVTQADLRIANDGVGLPPYQRVVDANTYDTAGFPLYLKPDGVDDFLQTASVAFSGTDKLFVAVALRKLSDASASSFVELSSTYANAGTFAIFAPAIPNNGEISFGLNGSAGGAPPYIRVMALSAPVSVVASCSFDISAPDRAAEIDPRINGIAPTATVWGNATVSAGSGGLGNYPLYFFRRGGASIPFSGRSYGTIIVGRVLSSIEQSAVGSYLRQKSRAF